MTDLPPSLVGDDPALHMGDACAVTLLILPALFEEANRMRHFTVSVMRLLAQRGIGSVLPDLPGTGESLRTFEGIGWQDWTDAVTAHAARIRATESRCLTVAIRGGALLDAAGDHRWRLAPESGERLLRDLLRATAFTSGESAKALDAQARISGARLSGHHFSSAFYTALMDARPADLPVRTIQIEGDASHADAHLAGTKLWRAAEPGADAPLAAATAADIANWVAACAA